MDRRIEWQLWPIQRNDKTFRLNVVEPRRFAPERHKLIVDRTLALLLAPPPQVAVETGLTEPAASRRGGGFDLLTFPEAFLSTEELLATIGETSRTRGTVGCIHTGLRPGPDKRHLFSVAELRDLTARIGSLEHVVADDIVNFENWVKGLPDGGHYNIGCLFTIDVERKVRVCLHAKMVRSPMEVSQNAGRHMTEGSLITLVTLQPEDRCLSSVTIQPLICADALDIAVDGVGIHPIEAVTTSRNDSRHLHSDRVDVVSIAAMTPVRVTGADSLAWHQRFREALVEGASKDRRQCHHRAVCVLANFGRVGEAQGKPAGLSGAFVPLPLYGGVPRTDHLSEALTVFGRFPDNCSDDAEQERWVGWTSAGQPSDRARQLGYIVSVDSKKTPDAALSTMFSVNLTRLPHDANRWQRTGGVGIMTVHDLLAAGAGDEKDDPSYQERTAL